MWPGRRSELLDVQRGSSFLRPTHLTPIRVRQISSLSQSQPLRGWDRELSFDHCQRWVQQRRKYASESAISGQLERMQSIIAQHQDIWLELRPVLWSEVCDSEVTPGLTRGFQCDKAGSLLSGLHRPGNLCYRGARVLTDVPLCRRASFCLLHWNFFPVKVSSLCFPIA